MDNTTPENLVQIPAHSSEPEASGLERKMHHRAGKIVNQTANEQENFDFLQKAGFSQEEFKNLDFNLDPDQFRLVFSHLAEKTPENIARITSTASSWGFKYIVDFLHENNGCIIDEYQIFYDFLADSRNFPFTVHPVQFLSYVVKIFDIRSTNQLIYQAKKEAHDIQDNSYQVTTKKFLDVAYALCHNQQEYEKWKKQKRRDDVMNFLNSQSKTNVRFYLSKFSGVDAFFTHISSDGFHFFKYAVERESIYYLNASMQKAYANEKILLLDQLYGAVHNKKLENPITVSGQSFQNPKTGKEYTVDPLYFNEKKCRIVGTCPDADNFFYEILRGDMDGIYKTYYYGEIPLGFTKKKGEKSFLALRDVVDENGNILFVRGGLYSVQWKDEDAQKSQIDVKQDPRAIVFFRMLNVLDSSKVLDTPKKYEIASNNFELVRNDIDRFLGTFKNQLKRIK